MNTLQGLRRRTVLSAVLTATTLTACGGMSLQAPKPLLDDESARLREVQFVLLGEVHDNPVQHSMRSALLTELLADGRPTRVVFEQMGRANDTLIAAAARDAESVATAGQLDRTGWRWPLHKPLIQAALTGGALIAGGDLSRDEVRAIVRGGTSAIPVDLRSLLDNSHWTPDDEAATRREIDAGHCGALPPSQFAGMALAQRSRDAALASAMLHAVGPNERVILIAGNGHVRRDLGVPRYLMAAGVAGSQIISIGYLEQSDSAAPYDLVRVTSAVSRPDPCAAFQK